MIIFDASSNRNTEVVGSRALRNAQQVSLVEGDAS